MIRKDIEQKQTGVLRRYFNESSDYWHSIYEGESFINLHMKERKDTVLNLAEKYSNGKKLSILDLGCGSGLLTKPLLAKGHSVTCLDLSEEMMTRLKQTVGKEEAFIRGPVMAEADKTCFRSGIFDIVLCIGVFQYQCKNDLLLKEISRLLKKDGICIFTIPNLLRVNFVLDPYYYLRFIVRFIRKKSNPQPELNCGLGGLSGKLSETSPYDKKYLLWELNKFIHASKLMIKETVAFGYGPITFVKKEVLPDHISFSFSKVVTKWAAESNAVLLKMFANRWAFVVQKN